MGLNKENAGWVPRLLSDEKAEMQHQMNSFGSMNIIFTELYLWMRFIYIFTNQNKIWKYDVVGFNVTTSDEEH